MVINRVGPPVRGNDLYGRDAFVNLLWSKLGRGNILLAAPRRFGKTSVMYKLIDDPKSDFKIIHADLEHLSEPADLIVELMVKLTSDNRMAQLIEGLAAKTSEALHGIRTATDELSAFNFKIKLKDEIRPNWQESGKQLFKKLESAGQPVLFILDEFPMMIDRMARLDGKRDEARYLLRWLRALRESPELHTVRFLIAGSIGIGTVLNQLGEISAINDFEQLRLGPFTPEVADSFLVELAKTDHLDLSDECRKTVVDLVGVPVPFFLQILYSEIAKATQLDGMPLLPQAIEKLYRDKVLGVDCKTYFDHYYGRLRDYYQPAEEKALKRLLREMARVPGLSQDNCFAIYRDAIGEEADQEVFVGTLSNLENDFYIRFDHESNQYQFACKILRDWWLRHYGMETI